MHAPSPDRTLADLDPARPQDLLRHPGPAASGGERDDACAQAMADIPAHGDGSS